MPTAISIHYLNVFHFHKVDRSLNVKIHSEQRTSDRRVILTDFCTLHLLKLQQTCDEISINNVKSQTSGQLTTKICDLNVNRAKYFFIFNLLYASATILNSVIVVKLFSDFRNQ